MKLAAKLLYWKLCFPEFISLLPVRLRVVSGPFCGMPYTIVACASAHSAKLLGTYEKELHAIISEAQQQPYDRIIDIGAAEGYYAVGFARAQSNPDCRVIAFEAQDLGRELLRRLATSNGVTNLEIRGSCGVEDLASALGEGRNNLIICDVEGFETELLVPDRLPGLRSCSLLVELHDSPGVPISAMIRERFQPSHHIHEVTSAERTWRDFPGSNVFSRLLPRALALRAMNESRDSQRWFWMRPRSA